MNVPHKLKTFLDDVLLKALSDIGDGVVVLEESFIVYAYDAFCKITGFSEEELLSLPSFFDLFSIEDREKISKKILSIPKNLKNPERHEAVVRGREKGKIYLELTVNQIKEGTHTRLILLIRDLTEKKKLTETVRDQESQYRLLFQSNPNPMFIYDLDSLAILDVNDSAIQKYGYTRDEFLKITLKDMRAAQDLPQLLQQVSEFKKGIIPIKQEVRHRKNDGSLMDVEVISHSIQFHGKNARVVLAYDLTEHKKAKRALQESQERLETVITNAPVILYALDQNGVITLSEGNGLKGLGLKPGEMVGKSVFDLYRDNPEIVQGLKRALSGEKFTANIEIGGSLFETRQSPILNAQGEITGIIGTATDITEGRRMQEALRKRHEFEQMITSLSSHFINLAPEKMDEGIHNALQSIGKFIGVDRIQMFLKYDEKLTGPVFSWYSKGSAAPEDRKMEFALSDFPWFSEKIKKQEVLHVSSPEELPAMAAAEKKLLQLRSVQSIAVIPMVYGGDVIGLLTFSTIRAKKTWVEDDLAIFKITGEIFAGALVRGRSEKALLESEGRFKDLFNNAYDAIFLFGISDTAEPTHFLEVNNIACQKLGYTREELLGLTPFDLGSPEELQEMPKILKKCLQEEHVTFEKVLLAKNGTKIPFENNARIFTRNGQKVVLSIARDLTERKKAEETIRRQAYYDVLTGLPNRMLMKDRLEQAMKQAHRNKQMLAVVILDLDRFKNINETLGHQVGDKLLLAVSERLLGILSESETIARFGGDEFTLLLPQVADVEEATRRAQKIIETLAAPFQLSHHELHVTTSIGIAFYPEDGENPEILLKNAETAMYRAKEQGRNNYQLYASVMNVSAFKQLLMENSLRRALEKEEFVVYYQPQIDLKTRKILGAEALVRWKHPDLGLVFPTEFIGLAEDTGLIVPIGEWIIRKTCAQMKKWGNEGYQNICISVNLSARQFQQHNLVHTISGILAETGVDSQRLGFEITESIAMKNADFTVAALNELKKMKIHLSLDDFGTGYSSLSYLKRFPLETIKIDRSFVRDITTDANDAAIVTAVIALAHSLKLAVVAEGVETEGQLNFLKLHDCDQMQGYFFSQPLPENEFLRLLSKK